MSNPTEKTWKAVRVTIPNDRDPATVLAAFLNTHKIQPGEFSVISKSAKGDPALVSMGMADSEFSLTVFTNTL